MNIEKTWIEERNEEVMNDTHYSHVIVEYYDDDDWMNEVEYHD
jgi:hypothetical protein